MALSPGSRIGQYEILGSIGAGGMGEVYRARDTSLRRDVALKILPEAFANDPERHARFEREAHALAALNHPNIAQVYGLEKAGDGSGHVRALVMELVEGEDLSQRIARGQIPVSDALPIARQIAEALEAAHDAGIIHRDLKPANVKVRDDGTVKVLDFGLAKALTGDANSGGSTGAMTMTSPAQTQHGVILGTASYMSPEQARGRAVDKRADIWAFGVVLFEMLTGRAMFPGETITDVLALVVTREPDWTALPPDTPAPIRRLLRRCLEKDPKRRLRDAADARIEIEEGQHELEAGVVSSPTQHDGGRRARRPWIPIALTAGALAIGLVFGSMFLGGQSEAVTPFRRLNLAVPTASASSVAISPDGRWVAVIFDRKIFLKGMDESAWRELPGTDGAGSPLVWAPDSRRIAFPAMNSLRKVDLVGSRPQTICDRCIQQNSLRGGSWNSDGVILLGGSPEDVKLGGGLLTISESGGAMKSVTTMDASRGENSHRYPEFLPDGHHFTFTIRRDNGEHEIRVADLSGSPTRLLVSGFSKTVYTSGYLLFAREETLLALQFDATTATSSGDPIKVADRVAGNVGTGLFSFGVSTDGTLVYGEAPATRGYVLLDRYGRKLADVTTRQSDGGGRLSPDGRRAAIAEMDPEKSSTDIYIVDLATGARTRLTSDPAWEQQPAWSPDGARVAYRQGPTIFIQDADGGNRRKVSDFGTGSAGFVHDWSADGKYLLVTESAIAGNTLAKFSIADGTIESLAPNEATQAGDARLSGDDRWVAFLSRETGSTEVHIRSFPDFRVSHRVTTTGGDTPLWSRDGKELFYRDSDGWIVAVGVRVSGSAIETGLPQRLFRPNIANTWGVGYQHDVDTTGRFFVYRVGDDTGAFANTLTVMLNWTKAIAR